MLLTRLTSISVALITQLQSAYATPGQNLAQFFDIKAKISIAGTMTPVEYYIDQNTHSLMWKVSSDEPVQQVLFPEQMTELATSSTTMPNPENIFDLEDAPGFYLNHNGDLLNLSTTQYPELLNIGGGNYIPMTRQNWREITMALHISEEDIIRGTGTVVSFYNRPVPAGYRKLEAVAIELLSPQAINPGSGIQECPINRPTVRIPRLIRDLRYRVNCQQLVMFLCVFGVFGSFAMCVKDVLNHHGSRALAEHVIIGVGFLFMFHIYVHWFPALLERMEENNPAIENGGLRQNGNVEQVDRQFNINDNTSDNQNQRGRGHRRMAQESSD